MIDRIKKLANPYLPITHKLEQGQFVGRDAQVDMFVKMIEDFKQSQLTSNILVSGPKSIGKSTLLNRFKDILEDNNFVVYSTELSRDPSQAVDEFEFFRELIGDLFSRFAPPEGRFLDASQTQVWFELTMGEYESKSPILDRRLQFPTQYSNRKKGRHEVLNYKSLETDFSTIIDQLTGPQMEFAGMAILIDEVQELARNSFILDTLRRLTETHKTLLVVGAGLPTFLNNPLFEKFMRTALPLTLRNMDESGTFLMVTKPLQVKAKISKHDAFHLFDLATLENLVERTGGNPLHVRILCAKLFDDFCGQANSRVMKLNRRVMDQVMEYYCNTSEQSRRIRSSLESCTGDQLTAFKRLYRFGGFNLKATVLVKNAFASIQNEYIDSTKEEIVSDLESVFDLGLFLLEGVSKPDEVRGLNLDQLSHVSLKFIGDSIDRLYTEYFFEDLTNDQLQEPEPGGFEVELARKLCFEIEAAVKKEKLQVDSVGQRTLMKLRPDSEAWGSSPEPIISEIRKLEGIKEGATLDEKTRAMVNDVAKKLDLDLPAIESSVYQHEGYYLLMTSVLVRGKRMLSFNYLPVKTGIKDVVPLSERLADLKTLIGASLDEYSVKINWMYVHWIKKISLYLVFVVDKSEDEKILFGHVAQRKYEEAALVAEKIFTLGIKLREGQAYSQLQELNNYGFCLINVSSLDKAEEIFDEILDKYLISQVNQAYLFFAKSRTQESIDILKRIERKKLGKDSSAFYLHLTIEHPLLSHGDKMVADILIDDVVHWNLGLLFAQTKGDEGTVNYYLKRVRAAAKRTPNHQRVCYWIKYYQHKASEAIALAKQLQKTIGDDEFLQEAVGKDITAFQS